VRWRISFPSHKVPTDIEKDASRSAPCNLRTKSALEMNSMSPPRSGLLLFAAILTVVATLQSVEANSAASSLQQPRMAHTRHSFLPRRRRHSNGSGCSNPINGRGVSSSSVAGLDFLDSPVRSAVSQNRPLSWHSRPQHPHEENTVVPCSSSIGNTLLRGAFLRIASDLPAAHHSKASRPALRSPRKVRGKPRATLSSRAVWQSCGRARRVGPWKEP
jgi:hypothetical protein